MRINKTNIGLFNHFHVKEKIFNLCSSDTLFIKYPTELCMGMYRLFTNYVLNNENTSKRCMSDEYYGLTGN